jgi:hypothetical protein
LVVDKELMVGKVVLINKEEKPKPDLVPLKLVKT